MSEELRDAIAQWLWAMDGIGEWHDWPELHADYLARADAYVADAPWLAALIADAERVRELEATVARVRKLIAFYDRHEYSSLDVDDLRRALDGDQ